MKWYLNYSALKCHCQDDALVTCLITVTDKVTVARLRTAFPEYFELTSEPTPFPIPRSAYQARFAALPGDGEEECGAAAWFGAPITEFETNQTPHPRNTETPLPDDFVVERMNGYNGFIDNPWCFTHDGRDYFVISVIDKCGDGVILRAIPLLWVDLKK